MSTLPNENIDPYLKRQKPFLLEMSKAVWNSNESGEYNKIFYRNQARYEEIKDYALGIQSHTKYKPMLGIDESSDKSWLNIDWSIRRIVPKFRNIAINKIAKTRYTTNCTPIDPLAKDIMDRQYAETKAKILMRDALKKFGSEIAESAQLKRQEGEPEDLEELAMQNEFGAKNNMAMEAELGIEVVFNENNIEDIERELIESLIDYGVAGVKEYIDAEGRVRIRPVDMRYFGSNFCTKKNFSDMTRAWEIIDVPVSELATIFNDDSIIEQIKNAAMQRNYNAPTNMASRGQIYGYDTTKARVMDLVFVSYDKEVMEINISSKGNIVSAKADYKFKDKTDTVNINGQEVPRYMTKKVQNLYQCKWIIGTDLIYDYGLAKNMKRSTDPKKMADTSLPYHFYAPNFHDMKATSIMDALIPIADEFQLTVYRIQNFKNRWIPYVIELDLNAIEDVALGAGGTKMKPSEVLQMMFQTNVLIGRKRDMSGGNVNYKSVDIYPTQMAAEFNALVADLERIKNDLRDISGLNELTDGSTPDAKTLVPIAAAAQEATNNALSGVIYGRKYILESLAKGVLQRLQIAVATTGKYEGYYNALGSNSVKFFQVSDRICLHYYGIKLEERTTDEMKQYMVQYMQKDIEQGFLSTADVYMIMTMYNTKQAFQYLNYIVKKNKEKQRQEAIQMQQSNAQVQTESALAIEKAKQETLKLQSMLKIQEINIAKEWDFKIKLAHTQGTIEGKNIDASAKVASTAISSGHNYPQQPGAEMEEEEDSMENEDESSMSDQLEDMAEGEQEAQ